MLNPYITSYMERRELIKLVTLATGAALAVPLTSSLLTACKKVAPVEDLNYTTQFFNEQDFSLAQNLLNFILPKTESPSAVDVGVHQIMDTMVGTVYSPEQKEKFSKQFAVLKTYCNSETQLEQLKGIVTSTEEKDQMAKSAFLEFKQQTIAYYLSTEEIATNYLNYLPVPGTYESCISLESVGGKAWAL